MILNIDCATIEMAMSLWLNRTELAKSAYKQGYSNVQIACQGVNTYPTFCCNTILAMKNSPNQTPIDLASYQAVLELLASSNALVTVTHNETDQCLLINEQGGGDRLIWQPHRYLGLNCRAMWRDSMDQYEALKRELRQNTKIENFTYRLRRVDDSLAEFTKDYYLVENFLGTPVRVAISRDWRPL